MNFTSEPWVILSDIERSIKAKIEKYGTPLRNWNIHIYRGILTGCNEAFIIDETKKEELIKKDPKSAEIIRPILRGKDIKRNAYEFANLWLLFIPWHFPLQNDTSITGCSQKAEELFRKEYPAVYEHLLKFKDKLSKRNQAETGVRYEWYALQRWGANYSDDFNKPKICYSETNNAKETKIALDTSCFYPDKTCFVLVSDNNDIEHIYNILSSDIFTWYMYNTSPLLGDGGISLTKDSVLRFPLCKEHADYGLTESEINCISESLKQ